LPTNRDSLVTAVSIYAPIYVRTDHGEALPEAKRGFVLLPRRWVVERSFAWATRFRRLVKDYELHVVAFACLMMKQAAAFAEGS
jgi:transposase